MINLLTFGGWGHKINANKPQKDKNQCVCNIVILYKNKPCGVMGVGGRWTYNIQRFLSCLQFLYQMSLFRMMRPM